MKIITVLLAVAMLATAARAQKSIKVYVGVRPTSNGPFVNTEGKDLEDSAKDIRDRLKKVTVVNDPAGADVVLYVYQRGVENASSVLTTQGVFGEQHTSQETVYAVRAIAIIGKYNMQLVGYTPTYGVIHGEWLNDARQIAGQIETWTKMNESRLIGLRGKP